MAMQFGLLPTAAMLPVAVLVGYFLYVNFSGGSHTLASVFGLGRAGFFFLGGLVTMLGGTPFHLVVGGLLIIWAVYTGLGHKDRLEETTSGSTVRSRLLD